MIEIAIPENASLGNNAFGSCTSLAEVIFPKKLSEADMNVTFGKCTSLTQIAIPEGPPVLNAVFWDCTSLTKLTIPSSIKMMLMPCYNCPSLSEIRIAATIPPTIYDSGNVPSGYSGTLPHAAFDSSVYSTCTLYVPQGCVDVYKAAYGWGNFTNIVEME